MDEPIHFPDDQVHTLQAARDRARAAFLIQLVSMTTGVSARDIAHQTRARSESARARWLAVYLMHIAFSVPLMRVAAAFGRDRTTVSQIVHRIEDWRSDPAFDAALSALERCAAAAPLEMSPEALNVCGRLGGSDRALAA